MKVAVPTTTGRRVVELERVTNALDDFELAFREATIDMLNSKPLRACMRVTQAREHLEQEIARAIRREASR